MGHSNRAYWIMCFALSNQNGAVVIEAEEGNMPTALRKSKGFDNLSDFCTLSDFAAVFGISKATAYRMVDQGRIPCIRLGKRIILSKSHLKSLRSAHGWIVGWKTTPVPPSNILLIAATSSMSAPISSRRLAVCI